MSMIFKFRMLSDENDRFVRDYEVMYDMPLLDFEDFIRRNLNYEPAMTSFFTAGPKWEKYREFTMEDMGDTGPDGPVPMEGVVLGQTIHRNHARLIYHFDMFGNRAYYLELTGVGEARPDTKYPRVVLAEEDAPDQYDPTANETEGSAFDEMMDEFNGFESYDDGGSDYDESY